MFSKYDLGLGMCAFLVGMAMGMFIMRSKMLQKYETVYEVVTPAYGKLGYGVPIEVHDPNDKSSQ